MGQKVPFLLFVSQVKELSSHVQEYLIDDHRITRLRSKKDSEINLIGNKPCQDKDRKFGHTISPSITGEEKKKGGDRPKVLRIPWIVHPKDMTGSFNTISVGQTNK